jgi:hypothetical protein
MSSPAIAGDDRLQYPTSRPRRAAIITSCSPPGDAGRSRRHARTQSPVRGIRGTNRRPDTHSQDVRRALLRLAGSRDGSLGSVSALGNKKGMETSDIEPSRLRPFQSWHLGERGAGPLRAWPSNRRLLRRSRAVRPSDHDSTPRVRPAPVVHASLRVLRARRWLRTSQLAMETSLYAGLKGVYRRVPSRREHTSNS